MKSGKGVVGRNFIIEENSCTPCRKTEKNAVSKYYCTDCEAYFCEPCFQFHTRIPLLEKHIVLKGSDIGIWSKLPYKCKTHDKSYEFFCGTHGSLCCHICVSLQHRSCSDMEYIPEKAKSICTKQEFKDMKTNTDKEIKEIVSCKEKFDKKAIIIKNSKEKCIKTLKEQRKVINDLFDSLERKTVEYMDIKCNENNKFINRGNSEIQVYMQELVHLKEQLDTATPEKEVLVFISLKKGEKTLSDIKQKLSKLDASPNKDEYQLVTHSEIERFIQNLPDLGYIEDEQSRQDSASDDVSNITKSPRKERNICQICGRRCYNRKCYSCST